ncbi:hypothetical protein BD410DRAFT_794144 [Rickenella mellea]|uniref:Mucoidy inhibitor A n=1 Tax=Rickenella mellea TaxID=50990 RepID=A0A4Y7PQG6_9AGAM|nr:hypothetical protein BD410DRAFT_794144 [Rickenella mellea]
MTNAVSYDATQHDVEAVTVFQKNSAEITRRIKVSLKDGQNDVEVTNLPTCLDQNSIRVDGIGNAIIFDVIYHPPPVVKNKALDEALVDLNTRRAKLNAELNIVKRQSEVLTDYSKTLSGKDTTSEQLDTFLNVYSTKQSKFDEEQTRLEELIKKIDEEVAEITKKFNADKESIKMRGVKITVIVLGEGDGDAELSLTYVVSNAWWTPQYDLRAAIAQTEKEKSSVNLHYRASISQSTGEDWSNVALRLSTASPLQGTTIPTLHPYWIGEQRMRKSASKSMSINPLSSVASGISGAANSLSLAKKASYRSATIDDGSETIGSAPKFMSIRETITTEGAVSATFSIPGQSTIPSDKQTSAQTHKVSIAEIELTSVDLEWITVPKDIPSTFLQCKVKNTSKFVLLPGHANVFMNNSFVAKSWVQHVSPQESFTCSLGVDPAVRVTYHPQNKKVRTVGSMLTSKTAYSTFEQRISVKNTRLAPIRRLVIKEQVPNSSDSRIKITLLEPKELHGQTGAKQIREGVLAQWVRRHPDDKNEEEPGCEAAQGLIEWVCEVGPAAIVDVTLAWEVTSPAGLNWTRM